MSARGTLRTLILAAIASPWLADAGAAPDARDTAEAVVQVYGARAMGVKGWFAVHTWVAVKPTDASGKDYLGSTVLSTAPSGSGFQLSLFGLLGIAASGVDGLEVNLLGLNFGLGPSGLKLPVLGRLG